MKQAKNIVCSDANTETEFAPSAACSKKSSFSAQSVDETVVTSTGSVISTGIVGAVVVVGGAVVVVGGAVVVVVGGAVVVELKALVRAGALVDISVFSIDGLVVGGAEVVAIDVVDAEATVVVSLSTSYFDMAFEMSLGIVSGAGVVMLAAPKTNS